MSDDVYKDKADDDRFDNCEVCECSGCKGVFIVPYYEGMPEISHPSFCPFCGGEFTYINEVEAI